VPCIGWSAFQGLPRGIQPAFAQEDAVQTVLLHDTLLALETRHSPPLLLLVKNRLVIIIIITTIIIIIKLPNRLVISLIQG
jgi:hypothetical protein